MSSATGIAASRLSSSWAKALVAGGALAVIAIVVVGIALLRDDEGDARRAARQAAVAQYIVEVNQTQQTLVLELERVSAAYRKLRISAKPAPGQVERLEAAVDTLRDLRTEIAAVPAPREARALRRELLQLLTLQVEIAEEVTALARYLPSETLAQQQFAAATRRLRRDLGAADTAAEQDAVFAGYRAELVPIATRLEGTDAPAVVEPSRLAEVERLRALVAIVGRIRGALAERRVKDVEALFAHFARTSGATGTTPAERRAVVAFNERLAAIVDHRKRLNAERLRVQRQLAN